MHLPARNDRHAFLPAHGHTHRLAALEVRPGISRGILVPGLAGHLGRMAHHSSRCRLYFVARYLGYDPRLYLGSMNDWIGDPARPLARANCV